jgi:hypothetical protein
VRRLNTFCSRVNRVDLWKGANHGKQGTRQEQGKEKEEEREAGAAEEVVEEGKNIYNPQSDI